MAEAFNRSLLGMLRIAQGRQEHAIQQHKQALALEFTGGVVGLHTELLKQHGDEFLRRGPSPGVREQHTEALHIAERADGGYETARACHGLAAGHLALGESGLATSYLARAADLETVPGISPRIGEPPTREPESTG
jgi:hypothetical protein